MKVSERYSPDEIVELKNLQGKSRITYEKIAIILQGNPNQTTKKDVPYITYETIDGKAVIPETGVERVLTPIDLARIGEKIKADEGIKNTYELLEMQHRDVIGGGLAAEIKQEYFENRAAYYKERVEKGRRFLRLLNGTAKPSQQTETVDEIRGDGYDGEIKLEETKEE